MAVEPVIRPRQRLTRIPLCLSPRGFACRTAAVTGLAADDTAAICGVSTVEAEGPEAEASRPLEFPASGQWTCAVNVAPADDQQFRMQEQRDDRRPRGQPTISAFLSMLYRLGESTCPFRQLDRRDRRGLTRPGRTWPPSGELHSPTRGRLVR